MEAQINIGEEVVEYLYGQYDGRRLNAWNKLPPQLWRRLQVLDVFNGEMCCASDNKECTLAVTADLYPPVVVHAEPASEGVEGHQGLGHGLLEPGHVEEISRGNIVGAVKVDCRGVASVGQREVQG